MHIRCSMEHISIDEIVHDVLRDQEQETIQVLVNKLADEGIKKGSDLFKVSAHALEIKFASKAHFSLDETGYVNELRKWAEKNIDSNKEDRSRSRSPRPWTLRYSE